MTEIVKGKTEQEAEELFKKFHEMTTGKDENLILRLLASWQYWQVCVNIRHG